MLTLVVAIVGFVAALGLLRASRRAEAGGHLRDLATRGRWRLPTRARAWLAHALEDAAIDVLPEEATELWIATVGALGLLGVGLVPSLAVPLAIVGVAAGPLGLRFARGRARQRFTAAVPAALEQVSAGLRGGVTVAEALGVLADGRGPLAPDLRRVRARAALGLGLAEALALWPAERDVPSARAAAGALALAVTVGGPSARAIDGLAASLRERMAAAAEARALAAQARLSAIVVGAAPLAFLAISALVDPSSVRVLVSTGSGRVCLVVGLALETLALLWMRRIVRDDLLA